MKSTSFKPHTKDTRRLASDCDGTPESCMTLELRQQPHKGVSIAGDFRRARRERVHGFSCGDALDGRSGAQSSLETFLRQIYFTYVN